MFDPIVIPITPVFVTPGVKPITEIAVPFPVEPFGEYIPPTDATLRALHEVFVRFDVLNEVVFERILHHLAISNQYEPGHLNRHSAEYCIAWAVVCANSCKDLRGKELSEWLRWLAFVKHVDPWIEGVWRKWQEQIIA